MKLFVTDYDGTLYVDEETLQKNIIGLNKLQQKDFKIMISTGRGYSSIKKQINQYNIPYDYIACADGSVLYSKEEVIIAYPIDKEIIQEFLFLKEISNYEEIQFSYIEGYNSIYIENIEILGINFVINTDNLTTKITDYFWNLKTKYQNYNFIIYNHGNIAYLCLKGKNITKASSIKYLEKTHHLKKENIYVIGDGDNDIEAIQEYSGFNIKNGNTKLKKISVKEYNNVYNLIDELL